MSPTMVSLYYKHVCPVDIAKKFVEYYTVTGTPKQQSNFPLRDQFYRNVGHRIRTLREEKDISQKTLAEAVGLSRTSLTNIEKGRQKMLLHTLYEIAQQLGVPAGDLFPVAANGLGVLNVELPPTLPPEQRAFVERALNPSIQYEPPDRKQDSGTSPSASEGKQHPRAARKR